MSKVFAPWTMEQVAALNLWQESDMAHPFTCGQRDQPGHLEYAQAHGEADHGILVATPEGWKCPVCDYTQNWAHEFMLHPPPTMRDLIAEVRGGFPDKCSFCKQPKTPEELHPEEAGEWICKDCIELDPNAYH